MVKLKGQDADGGARPDILPINEIVNVLLGGVELRTFQWDGEEQQRLRWEFVVKDAGPWQGKTIWGETSTKFVAHPNCKAYNWAQVLLGAPPDPQQGLDTDDLVGLPGRIMISHKQDAQGRTWMRAKEVLPAKAASAMPQPQETPF